MTDGPIVTIGIGLQIDNQQQEQQPENNSQNNNNNNKNNYNINDLGLIQFERNFNVDDVEQPEQKIITIAEHLLSLELNCHIKANPWIEKVLWYLNDTIIDVVDDYEKELENLSSTIHDITISSHHFHLTNHNQTLRLKTINRFIHSGYYRCKAFNSINESFSEIIKLNVACKY